MAFHKIISILTLLLLVALPLTAEDTIFLEADASLRTRGEPTRRDQQEAVTEALRKMALMGADEIEDDTIREVVKQRIQGEDLETLESYFLEYRKLRRQRRRGYIRIWLEGELRPAALNAQGKETAALSDLARNLKVMALIPESHIQRRVPDPAAETEMIRCFKEAGFQVVDVATAAALREKSSTLLSEKDGLEQLLALAQDYGVDILVTGEAFSHETQANSQLVGNMEVCRARVEARAVLCANAHIITSDGAEAGATDLSSLVAGKKALREAAGELSTTFIAAILGAIEKGDVPRLDPEKVEAWKPAFEPDAPKTVVVPGVRRALVIGIDKYEHWPFLRNAVNDARAVGEALKKHYGFSEVRSLYNDAATGENILKEMAELVEAIEAGDEVVIFYAGHGYYNATLNRGYWVTVGAEKESDFLPNSDLYDYLKAMNRKKVGHVFLVADACFSGAFFQNTRAIGVRPASDRALPEWLAKRAASPSRFALTSGSIEEVMDAGGEGHSFFTQSLLEVLRQPKSPFFTANELAQQVQKKVAAQGFQTPLYGVIGNTGHESGAFVFRKE